MYRTYLAIYNLVTISGRLWPFTPIHVAVLFSFPSYLSSIFAILVIQNYYFPPSLLFFFKFIEAQI